MQRRKGAGYLSPAEYCGSGGASTKVFYPDGCLNLTCTKSGPHYHKPLLNHYHTNSNENSNNNEQRQQALARRQQRKNEKQTFKQTVAEYRNRNRRTAKNSLRENLALHKAVRSTVNNSNSGYTTPEQKTKKQRTNA